MHALPLRHDDDVFYPDSDGQPMGESEVHVDEIVYLLQAFRERFKAAADVYVAGNMYLYFKQGDPAAVICPDLMVVRGVPKMERRTYKLWEEGAVPCLVIEVTSASTWREDLGRKKARYERLGIEEYFLYDPLGEAPRPALQGFRRVDGRYQPAPAEPDGSLASRTTGVTLRMEGQRIRLLDTASGRPLRRIAELHSALEAEAQARRAAEEELARLRRELADRG
jgi:Uma2 family endonuclease